MEQPTAGSFHPDPTQWVGGWLFGYSNLTFDLGACDGFADYPDSPVTPVGAAPNWGTFRGTDIAEGGVPIDIDDTYDATMQTCTSGALGYAVAGYWYADAPTTINNCGPCRGRMVQVVMDDGTIVDVAGPGVTPPRIDAKERLDVTEAVVEYLQASQNARGLGGLVTAENLPLHRINVKRLPTINPFPFQVVQPLLGARKETCPPL